MWYRKPKSTQFMNHLPYSLCNLAYYKPFNSLHPLQKFNCQQAILEEKIKGGLSQRQTLI